MPELQQTLKLPLGAECYLTANEQGLTGILWRDPGLPECTVHNARPFQWITAAREQLQEYCAGGRTSFALPLIIRGTPFQQRVWRELLTIPYGTTLSYTGLACRIGKPAAVRAVGSANGRNPLSIVIPCHRIIAKNATLAGYGGGVHIKHWLLQLEGVELSGALQPCLPGLS